MNDGGVFESQAQFGVLGLPRKVVTKRTISQCTTLSQRVLLAWGGISPGARAFVTGLMETPAERAYSACVCLTRRA